MKVKITKEWLVAAAKNEGGCEISACSPELMEQARRAALARGHTDPDAIIVCSDKINRPVWHFYIGDGAMTSHKWGE